MCDEWMPSLRFAISLDEFHRLPQHAAYRYEYVEGVARLSPWPRHEHARLDLDGFLARQPALETVEFGPITEADRPQLATLFAAAFHRVQPFGSLDDATRAQAAQGCLERTFTGGDGPWIAEASFAARAANGIAGAILITLLPGGDPAERSSYAWARPAPEDLWQAGLGQPHLTWIFVSPWHRADGVGTALLRAAAMVLQGRGYRELWSTFLVGNDLSALWHWRQGFALV